MAVNARFENNVTFVVFFSVFHGGCTQGGGVWFDFANHLADFAGWTGIRTTWRTERMSMFHPGVVLQLR